ncbi:MAG: sigma-E factor negative regulatory protein [Burkholderiales bacterium]|nr:sigma-E factor negative regulatory protein [Burkholderiales bacterium]
MKDVSALMDGELERKRVRSTITRLEDQDDLRDAWATFHVIRDTLQGNAIGPSRFTEKFHERLEQEPVPAVPSWRAQLPRMRTMLLTGLGGVLLVGSVAWLVNRDGPAATGRGDPRPAPFVDGGLNDSVAIEFAMAHRQLVPAFMAAPAAAGPADVPAASDGVERKGGPR